MDGVFYLFFLFCRLKLSRYRSSYQRLVRSFVARLLPKFSNTARLSTKPPPDARVVTHPQLGTVSSSQITVERSSSRPFGLLSSG